jgi:hypothetical protein
MGFTGYSSAQAATVSNQVKTSNAIASQVISSTNTTQLIELNCAASMITLQPSGNLVATYTVSANGTNFVAGGSLTGNALSTYNSNLVSSVTITWASGSGYVTILAVS